MSLKITKEKLKESSSNYIRLTINLALLYQDMGKLTESEAIYLNAIKLKEKKLGKNHPDYDHSLPMHDVEIAVLSGASAGGMTAIMAAAALQQEIQHISPDNRTDKEKKRANILYNGWVNILDGDMITHLLSTTDITQKSVNSLLNASFIDRVADRTLK